MKKLILLMLLVGCEVADPIEIHRTDNAQVPVSLLFTHEGCKIYRFGDDGQYRYFVKCSNGDASTSSDHIENCGKNCRHTVVEEVPTVVVKP